jgi:glutamate 5-kinase
MRKILINPTLERFFILFANRDINVVSENDAVAFNDVDFGKVDNERAVYAHELMRRKFFF